MKVKISLNNGQNKLQLTAIQLESSLTYVNTPCLLVKQISDFSTKY